MTFLLDTFFYRIGGPARIRTGNQSIMSALL